LNEIVPRGMTYNSVAIEILKAIDDEVAHRLSTKGSLKWKRNPPIKGYTDSIKITDVMKRLRYHGIGYKNCFPTREYVLDVIRDLAKGGLITKVA